VFAGSPPPPQAFWDRARQLGLRDRLTVVDQPEGPALLRLYQDASVFALSSDEEGFGLVLLEAMACGVPVVSTRSGGPDGIITDGEDGFLVPRDDAAALSTRLAQLLENDTLAACMGGKARRTIEQRFDERVAGRSFVEIWHRLGGA
jgi:glycosyltransferase involved in cell wall biosynthesis